MARLTIMVGVSGSGKSTIAKKFICPVVSTDNIREELLGDAGDQRNGAKIFQAAYDRLVYWLDGGDDVVFDATNLKSSDRRKVIEYCRSHVSVPFSVTAIVVKTPPLDVLRQRMIDRGRIVSDSVIERQIYNFTIPTTSEGFDLILMCDDIAEN